MTTDAPEFYIPESELQDAFALIGGVEGNLRDRARRLFNFSVMVRIDGYVDNPKGRNTISSWKISIHLEAGRACFKRMSRRATSYCTVDTLAEFDERIRLAALYLEHRKR